VDINRDRRENVSESKTLKSFTRVRVESSSEALVNGLDTSVSGTLDGLDGIDGAAGDWGWYDGDIRHVVTLIL